MIELELPPGISGADDFSQSSAVEDYLRVISTYESEGIAPRASLMRSHFGVSPATVSGALRRMNREGLLFLDPERTMATAATERGTLSSAKSGVRTVTTSQAVRNTSMCAPGSSACSSSQRMRFTFAASRSSTRTMVAGPAGVSESRRIVRRSGLVIRPSPGVRALTSYRYLPKSTATTASAKVACDGSSMTS